MTREEARLTLQENFGYLSEEHPRIVEALKVALKELSRPSLPSNINDAAKEYLKQYNESEFGNGGDDWDDDILITFKAGAEWMTEQGYSQEETVEDKCLEIGYGTLPGISPIINLPNSFKPGDKVIVQIRKK